MGGCKRECVSWGILDSSHTPVGYKIEFKGGNSPLVLCQQRPVGPRLPFNQQLEVRALWCVHALMFRKKGKGKTARVSTQIQRDEIAYASKCVCGVRLHSVGSALCTAEITSSRPFKPLLSVGVHANCPAVRWHAACQQHSCCIMGMVHICGLLYFHCSQCHLGLLRCDIYSACG